MQHQSHLNFIHTPIWHYIKETIDVCQAIGDGIETYPLKEYIFQSLFLKMTGSQEQKFKCVCWEIASDDYEFRYDFLNRFQLGECSKLEDKKTVLKNILHKVSTLDDTFKLSENRYLQILDRVKKEFKSLFNGSNIIKWFEREFRYAESIINKSVIKFNSKQYTILNQIEKAGFSNIYTNHLYRHRNRCAHNLLSYQENLPSLRILKTKDYDYNNYFLYFFILMLIDADLIDLFDIYISKKDLLI